MNPAFFPFMTLVYFAVLIATGWAVLRLIPSDEKERYPAELWLPVSFALGIAFQGIVYMLSLLILRQVWFPIYIMSSLVLFGTLFYKHPRLSFARFQGFDLALGPEDKQYRILYWLAWTMVITMVAVLIFQALTFTMNIYYDGKSIWIYKSKLLFHEHTIFSEAFLDPLRVHYHRDYPLLMPIANYNLYNFLGAESDDFVRILNIVFLMFFLLFLFHWSARFTNRSLATLIVFFFAAYPYTWYWARGGIGITNGDVDFPLACFAAFSAGLYYFYWREKKLYYLILASILCGLCLVTKKEGMVAFAVIYAANGLKWLATPKNQKVVVLKHGLMALGITILVAAPGSILSAMMPNLYDEKFFDMIRPENLDFVHKRYPIIISEFIGDVSRVDKWSFFWYFYLVIVILSIRNWFARGSFFLDAIIILWMTAYTIVYIFTPLNLIFHITTSLGRLLGHFFPIVFLRIVLFYGEWRTMALSKKL